MLKQFTSALKDILYPKNCHICSKILKGRVNAFDDNLCLDCVSSMRRTGTKGCVTTCYAYEGSTRELIHKFKYANRPYLYESVVRLMSPTLNPALFDGVDNLVPIPLHPARLREREFNQSELIAQGLGLFFNKPVAKMLIKVRNTASQTSFSTDERLSNMKGAFAASTPAITRGKNILLIDDVVTSSATTAEATRVLKEAGAAKIGVLAFAQG